MLYRVRNTGGPEDSQVTTSGVLCGVHTPLGGSKLSEGLSKLLARVLRVGFVLTMPRQRRRKLPAPKHSSGQTSCSCSLSFCPSCPTLPFLTSLFHLRMSLMKQERIVLLLTLRAAFSVFGGTVGPRDSPERRMSCFHAGEHLSHYLSCILSWTLLQKE